MVTGCITEYMLEVELVILGPFTARYKSWWMLKISKIEREVENFYSVYETRSKQYNNEIHNEIIVSYPVVKFMKVGGLFKSLIRRRGYKCVVCLYL